MKIIDVAKTLKSFGWSTSKDESGDRIACYHMDDRMLVIVYGLKKLPHYQQLWVMRSITTRSFSGACKIIDLGHGDYAPLVSPWNDPDIRAPEIQEVHIRQVSDETITWAREQNLDKALQGYAELSTSAPGAQPIWHLAALALLHRVEILKRYQASFAAGDRLGFVPYVTKDFIDRAVALAENSTA